jgi:D-2-hydroxyacid dehydrogenase (NADP+)
MPPMPALNKIVLTVDLQERHLDRLRKEFPDLEIAVCEDREQIHEYLNGAQALIGGGLKPEYIEQFPDLQWAQSPGAGVDSYLFRELIECDITVTNNSGVHAPNIAEHLLGMMLAFARGFPELVRNQQNHVWQRPSTAVFELGYQTLAVVGLGDIGQALAVRAKCLGMRVVGNRRRTNEAIDGIDQLYAPEDLHEMLAEADHVAITLPLTARTRNLFGPDEFKAMKSTAIIYNIGRGEIIDQDAMIEALRSGEIGGAGLDVTTPEPLDEVSPLWDLPNVFLTPHCSGATPHYWDRGIELLVENIRRFRADEPMLNVVDKQEGY